MFFIMNHDIFVAAKGAHVLIKCFKKNLLNKELNVLISEYISCRETAKN